MTGDVERDWVLREPFDLAATVRPLASGFGDPTQRATSSGWLWGVRMEAGPATLCVERAGANRLRLRGFGPGAEAIVEAAPAALGLDRPPPAPESLPPVARRLARIARGLRLQRLPGWIAPLTLLVLQQKVSGKEAARAHRELVRAISEPAPGAEAEAVALWLPPSAEALRRLPEWACAPLGIPPRQGETLRRIGFQAGRIEALRAQPELVAAKGLLSIPGVGPWTASALLLRAAGAEDRVLVGDLHLPSAVAYTLAGERRADDTRMLELLEPHRGHRGWMIRWIEAVGQSPPRRHPRQALRPLPEGRDAAVGALRRSR